MHETLAGGADAILLIVAALDTGTLIRLHSLATQLGLATLVEVHDAIELDAAHEIGAEIVGINNRDLTTLEVDVERTYRAAPGRPGRGRGRRRVGLPSSTPSSRSSRQRASTPCSSARR